MLCGGFRFIICILRAWADLRSSFENGLLIGLIPAAIISGIQIFALGLITLPNQSPYWTSLGRFTGTFTDPNAFGLFIALALPFFFIKSKDRGVLANLSRVYLVIWPVFALYSGSRTFFLALAGYLVVLLYQRSRSVFWVMAILALLLLPVATLLQSCLNMGGPPSKPKYSSVTDSELGIVTGKGEKHPGEGSEIAPETVRLQAVEGLWP